MRVFALFLCITSVLPAFVDSGEASPHDGIARLFLTPQRLKRLKRDRERQTERWLNFEKRVKEVPSSPERGLELAVYYAVTDDEQRGREAVAWAAAHPCELHQIKVIREVTGELSAQQPTSKSAPQPCSAGTSLLADFGIRDADSPDLFLLSLRPQEVEHPTWQQHVAALALVNLSPNSPYAQFLQGWAMEPRFTLHEGPGMVYEFLWANPYLPGVSYQNMDPWFYKEGTLYARSDWSEKACWFKIASEGIEQQNCPSTWQSQAVLFTDLLLVPMDEHCLDLKRDDAREVIILHGLKPGSKITFDEDNRKAKAEADTAGLWRVPQIVIGKVCVSR